MKPLQYWDEKQIQKFRSNLLRWYSENRRDLPWRHNPTPYRVWISEIMLQQTQVKAVVPYYNRFLEQFPDIESLARSSEQKVLKHWAGLGYYSRARNIHKAARHIVGIHGTFPTEHDEILALPGIGRYTAGAICSIALNQPRPIVDGNIRRVLIRLSAIRLKVPESHFWDLMKRLLPERNISSFNQAMMELGALICLPFQPNCMQCPLKSLCKAWESGIQNNIPKVHPNKSAKQLPIAILLLEQNGKMLITRGEKLRFIPGKWGLPCRPVSGQESAGETASRLCRKALGYAIELKPFAQIRHSITSHRIVAHGFCQKAHFPLTALKKADGYRWVPCSSHKQLLTSSLFLKMIQKYRSEC
jgi:A/G-specific adenine glycosylase